MPKKPDGRSKATSKSAPKLQKKTLRSLTSKARNDDRVVGGRHATSGYSCGINCSTSKDPTNG